MESLLRALLPACLPAVCFMVGCASPDSPWKASMKAAKTATAAGDYDAAEHAYFNAVHAAETPSRDERQLNRSLSELAQLYLDLERSREAVPLLERVYLSEQSLHGANHVETMVASLSLAKACREAGRLEESEQLLLKAHEFFRGRNGPFHINEAAVLGELAIVYLRQDRVAEARRALDEGLKRIRAGDRTANMLLLNRGVVGVREQAYDMAQQDFEACLAMQVSAGGPRHPLVGHTLHHLVVTSMINGRLRKVADFGHRLEPFRDPPIRGDITPGRYVAFSMAYLETQYSRGDAARLYQDTLDAMRRHLGVNHAEVSRLQGLQQRQRPEQEP